MATERALAFMARKGIEPRKKVTFLDVWWFPWLEDDIPSFFRPCLRSGYQSREEAIEAFAAEVEEALAYFNDVPEFNEA